MRTAFSYPLDFWSLGTNVLLLNSIGLTEGLTWNYPSWSIGAEFLTYIGFAVLVLVLRKNIFSILFILVGLCFWTIMSFSPDYIDATHDLGTVRCILGFSLGSLIWRYLQTDSFELTAPFATVLEIFAMLTVLIFVCTIGHHPGNIISPMLFAPIILLFSLESGLVSKLLRNRAFVYLGKISYSIYMVHAFFASRVFSSGLQILDNRTSFALLHSETGRFGASPMSGLLMTMVYIILVIITASMTYYLIEKPGMRLTQKILQREANLKPRI